jgi:hypothetical protein
MDGNDPSARVTALAGCSADDKSRQHGCFGHVRVIATINSLAEMPPQNDTWLGGREGRDLRVDGQRDPWTGRAGTGAPGEARTRQLN